jgi:hypothetical protein
VPKESTTSRWTAAGDVLGLLGLLVFLAYLLGLILGFYSAHSWEAATRMYLYCGFPWVTLMFLQIIDESGRQKSAVHAEFCTRNH